MRSADKCSHDIAWDDDCPRCSLVWYTHSVESFTKHLKYAEKMKSIAEKKVAELDDVEYRDRLATASGKIYRSRNPSTAPGEGG